MRGFPISYFDYSGGRNTQNAPYLLTEKQCRDDLNVHTSLSGDIEKRNGFVTLSGSTLTGEPVKATLVHSAFPANTTTKSLLLGVRTATTDSIVKMTTGGEASVLKSGLTANKLWYWAQAGVNAASGPIFGMNGVDTPQKWDGSAGTTSNWVASTGTVPTAAKYLIYFQQRLWCAEGSRVRFSGLTESSPDPLSWDADNYVDLEPNDGQIITGIGIQGNYLIVFKSRKTYKIYDTITGANQQISNEVGCVAHRSIVQTPVGLFFLSEDQGVCMTEGTKVKRMSDDVLPDFERVAKNPEVQALAAATMEGYRYQISVSLEGSRNDHTFEYDLQQQSWWLHDCATNEYALLDPGGTPTLYSADSTSSGRVSKAFVPDIFEDNGAKYKGKSYWTSPWYAWGISGKGLNPHIRKRLNEIRVDGVGNWRTYGAINFTEPFQELEGEVWEATADTAGIFGGEGKFGVTGTFGTNPNSNVDRRFYTPLEPARAFSFKYENDDTSNFRINSTTFTLTPRSD